MSRYSIDTPDVDVTSLAHNVESFGVTIQRDENCNFLAEQIRLMTTAAKDRRYSIDMLIIYNYMHLMCTTNHLLVMKKSGKYCVSLVNI